jgi:ribonuclease HI
MSNQELEPALNALAALAQNKDPRKVAPPEILASSCRLALEKLGYAIETSDTELVLQFDGASKGNPGPAGAGFVLYSKNGELVEEGSIALGIMTNNQAEYNALLAGLKAALNHKPRSLKIYSDSELVVKQLNGVYAIRKPELMTLAMEVRKLLAQFTVYKIIHYPRENNSHADMLATRAVTGDKRAL